MIIKKWEIPKLKKWDDFTNFKKVLEALDYDVPKTLSFIRFYKICTYHINILSWFIPWKNLILIWSYLMELNKYYWTIKVDIKYSHVKQFLEDTWFYAYLNSQNIEDIKANRNMKLPFYEMYNEDFMEKYIYKFIYNSVGLFNKNLDNQLIGFIADICSNAREHWKASSIYILGQKYPNPWEADISIYDNWNWMTCKNIDLTYFAVKEYIEEDFYINIIKNFWKFELFVILCVTTMFTTRMWWGWGNWLFTLSNFLLSNHWYIEISTKNLYLKIKIKSISEKVKLNQESIDILQCEELSVPMKWTFFSFTFKL